MKLSIVLSTQAAHFEAVAFQGAFEKNISKIANWGYDGVELAIRDPRLVNAGTLERVVKSHGLVVTAIGTGQAWGEEKLSFTSMDPSVRAAALERIQSHIPMAKRLNATIILGLIRGISPQGQSHTQSMKYLVENLKKCTEVAAVQGVRFALEPINRYETDLIHTVAEGLDLLDLVEAENIGLLLDTFHMNIEEPDIEKSILLCGKRIYHFHVADSNRWYPGGGHLDFASILKALYSTGYQGYVSGEFMPMPDSDSAAQLGITHLRQLSVL
jgi:sugar phosphate isomerase/epimerase